MAAEIMRAPPAPTTGLGHYRLLATTASVRVSPLCLGAMNFGNSWKSFMGECDQESTEKILDYFFDAGGNFIDTANNYQDEESEKWLGEWMSKRGNRDEVFLATKYTSAYRRDGSAKIQINTAGNGAKSLHTSVEASLKKLQTTYIDLLYVHWWDFTCSIPELMQSLNHLVTSGKVIYLGISDTPAWVVSKANEYARQNGLRQFSVYQGRWSAEHRDFEREIIPMCQDEGMALAPWGTLGGGQFKTEEQRKTASGGRATEASPEAIKVSQALEKVASRHKTQVTSIALAYVMQKAPYVFPIVGGRKIEHLKGNIEALNIELTEEDYTEIDGAIPFDVGFPINFIGGPNPKNSWLMMMVEPQQHFPLRKALGPAMK